MKKLITKIAAVACTLTVFGSLTAFSTETVAPQNTIGQTHIIELNNAINHECGAYCDTRYDAWQYTDWKFAFPLMDCRYRYRDVHVYCRYCGREVSTRRELQRQDKWWVIGAVNDWYDYYV